MIKKRAKRGAINWDQMMYFTLAITVIVLVILFFTGAFGDISSWWSQTNVDITLINQKCQQLASFDKKSFCVERIEIGKNSYVNCLYAIDNLGASLGDLEKPTCNGGDPIKEMCQKLKLEKGDSFKSKDFKVNNVLCSTETP